MKTVAIVLAAGSGSRMDSDIRKQYLELKDKPVVYYALKAFEDSFIDRVVLVCPQEDIEYCRKEIVEKYSLTKVRDIVPGGKERYNSVSNGLQIITNCDYVFIHDGARPLIDSEMLDRLLEEVQISGTAVAAVPSKDTVKIVDNEGYVISTPTRKTVWSVQTPQVFSFELIKEAYERMNSRLATLEQRGLVITDDAMVVEDFTGSKVKLVMGSYKNLKITTPEDMQVAECFMSDSRS